MDATNNMPQQVCNAPNLTWASKFRSIALIVWKHYYILLVYKDLNPCLKYISEEFQEINKLQ